MKIRSRRLNRLIAWLGTRTLRLMFLTVRFDHQSATQDATPYRPATGSQRFTFSLWHENIVLCVFGGRTFQLSGLISQHVDGGYLADVARYSGIEPVRGSTTRGGVGAVRRLLEMPKMHLAITPDGPQGPRRKLKDGVAFLSSRARRPVVPTALIASRAWFLHGRWTHLVIPRPFARVVAIAGTPIEIADDATREDIEAVLSVIESEMNRLEIIARKIVNGDESASQWIDRVGQIPEDWVNDADALAMSSQCQRAA
jgi:lysophospholipid acyltransferase (LPLAT)-like uncharacterized protein